jgi:hypothetical protein
VTQLWVGNPDWGDIQWIDEGLDEWNERVAPGRYIFEVQLVDEGNARLLTLRKSTALAKPPAVDPFWMSGPCRYCAEWGPMSTAIYIDVRDVPMPILRRMHP